MALHSYQGYLSLLTVVCFGVTLIFADSTLADNRQQMVRQQNDAELTTDQEYFDMKFAIESLIQTNKEIMDKLARLEAKQAELESTVNALENERTKGYTTAIGNRQRVNWPAAKIDTVYRTCREGRLVNPTLRSGMYFIDPDGLGIGDDPIYVYCDMETGTTSVLHDSESAINVTHCADPGCYSRPVVYSATAKQIKALFDLSATCRQSIRYDCFYAPFKTNGIAYSWWNDRNGISQTFWDGDGSNGHTCQCGNDGNCADPVLKCNCDSLAPVLLTDDGVITNKNLLPITRLNFGRTQLSLSIGKHTLGRLNCSGQAPIESIPSSCQDLWRMGHTLSGLYSVKASSKSIDTVFCDFTKDFSHLEFQKRIGQVDVKSLPVYFNVVRNTSTRVNQTGVVVFNIAKVNIGGAMDLTTGYFTAPTNGLYFFTFAGLAYLSLTTQCSLQVRFTTGGEICYFMRSNPSSNDYSSASLHSLIPMKSGDRVALEITRNDGAKLYDDKYHYNHFIGGLLQEDIAF